MAYWFAMSGLSLAQGQAAPTWASVGLAGKKLELISQRKTEIYKFHENGTVFAELESPNTVRTAPTYYWTIHNEFLILSEEPGGQKAVDSLELVAVNGNIVVTKKFFWRRRRFKLSNF
jgi:hypothetical protein